MINNKKKYTLKFLTQTWTWQNKYFMIVVDMKFFGRPNWKRCIMTLVKISKWNPLIDIKQLLLRMTMGSAPYVYHTSCYQTLHCSLNLFQIFLTGHNFNRTRLINIILQPNCFEAVLLLFFLCFLLILFLLLMSSLVLSLGNIWCWSEAPCDGRLVWV